MLGQGLIEIGQVWRVPGRGDLPDFDVLVRRIDKPTNVAAAGPEIGVTIFGIEITAPDDWPNVAHVPVSEASFRSIGVKLIGRGKSEASVDFDEAHSSWLQEYQAGEAGAFEMPLAEIYAFVVGAAEMERVR